METRPAADAVLAPLTSVLAAQVAAAVVQQLSEREEASTPWLDVRGAAEYLVTTEKGIRGLVSRREIPFTKTPNGRILFNRHKLEAWVKSEAA